MPVDNELCDRLSDTWWGDEGTLSMLRTALNPARFPWLRRTLTRTLGREPQGLRTLDVGCGGGLLAEPMARLGAAVTGIDAAPSNIAVARLHAVESGLSIDYRSQSAEQLAAAGERFDVVLALEVIEHVADVDAFLAACAGLLDERGLLVVATLNRTAKAFALAIVGAEYLLGWLPRGTHDWQRFVRPSEFVLGLRRHGLATTRLAGLSYDLRRREGAESEDLSVNYMLAATRR